MERHHFYDRPEDVIGTVFDPADETFGPIMAALQAGDFEQAHDLIAVLSGDSYHLCQPAARD